MWVKVFSPRKQGIRSSLPAKSLLTYANRWIGSSFRVRNLGKDTRQHQHPLTNHTRSTMLRNYFDLEEECVSVAICGYHWINRRGMFYPQISVSWDLLKRHEIYQHAHLPGPWEIHCNKSLGSVSRGRLLKMSHISIQGRVMQQKEPLQALKCQMLLNDELEVTIF